MSERLPSYPIQNPLTLVMKAKSAESWVELRRAVERLQSLPDDKKRAAASGADLSSEIPELYPCWRP